MSLSPIKLYYEVSEVFDLPRKLFHRLQNFENVRTIVIPPNVFCLLLLWWESKNSSLIRFADKFLNNKT